MKLINPKYEIIEQKNLEKHIELCGRVCYKSEDRITGDSAKKFVDRLIKSGHTSVLEHGTVYFTTHIDDIEHKLLVEITKNNPYSFVRNIGEYYYFTTNLRVLTDYQKVHGDLNNIFTLCNTKFIPNKHVRRVTVKFTISRAIANEFVRHRVFSFSQESSRYCDYTKGKFGNEISFIKPLWFGAFPDSKIVSLGGILTTANKDAPQEWSLGQRIFINALYQSEYYYKNMMDNGAAPQEARDVLPLSTKTELVMTGTIEQWKGFFKLRCSKAAHPDAEFISNALKQEFIDRHYIEDDGEEQ